MPRDRELLNEKVYHKDSWSLWQFEVYHYGWRVGTAWVLLTMVGGSPSHVEVNHSEYPGWVPSSITNWANGIMEQVATA